MGLPVATALALDATELRNLTGWKEPVIEEFLSIVRSITQRTVGNAKLVTGTTGAVAGDTVSVAHGVRFSRIVGVSAIVNTESLIVMPNDPDATQGFSVTVDETNVNLTTDAMATLVLEQPFNVILEYL